MWFWDQEFNPDFLLSVVFMYDSWVDVHDGSEHCPRKSHVLQEVIDNLVNGEAFWLVEVSPGLVTQPFHVVNGH